MRVTFLAHFPGKGGSNGMLRQMEAFLRERGHETTTLVGEDCPDPILQNYTAISAPRGKYWPDRLSAYADAIVKTNPGLVYSFSGKDELDVLRFIKGPRLRQVFSLEETEFTNMPLWLKQTGDFLEGLTANTPDVLEAAQRHSGASPAGWVLPYRVDPVFQEAKPPCIEQRDRIRICFIGRLESFQKRADWLPEIMRHSEMHGLKFEWHIFGAGPLEDQLRAETSRTNALPPVTFHGWVSSTELAKVLPSQDLIFFCSRWEGLPLALVQAMLCGVAAVCPTGPGGMSWVLRQGGGWLYDASGPDACAHALMEAASWDEIAKRKEQAHALARKLFHRTAVEPFWDNFERDLSRLASNGRGLQVHSGPRFQSVTPAAAIKRRLRALFRA